jgi:hypothetical protein
MIRSGICLVLGTIMASLALAHGVKITYEQYWGIGVILVWMSVLKD